MSDYPHYLQRLQDATRKFWDKPALNTIGGESLTYAQMATSIARFHIVFEKAGFQKGDKIALNARNGARWGFAYMAVNTYETVIVPILADFTPESVMGLVNHSDSIALFTNKDKWAKMDPERMPALKVVFDVDTWDMLLCRDEKISDAVAHWDELFAEKYPNGFGPDDVHFPTDNGTTSPRSTIPPAPQATRRVSCLPTGTSAPSWTTASAMSPPVTRWSPCFRWPTCTAL